MLYRKEGDLLVVHRCATGKIQAPDYYRCFVSDAEGQDSPKEAPASSRKRSRR
jgi:hypothetical protein